MESVSFKERVAQTAIRCSQQYKSVFVDYEYLLCSEAFVKQDYYIIAANANNYRHLIGVNTAISAEAFFDKCINNELTENDFDFSKPGRSEKEVKGSVRRKINSLEYFVTMMGRGLIAQEDYVKNGVVCSFATTDSNMTIGFINEGKARPKSLLYGNLIDRENAFPVELIIRRHVDAALFSEIVEGDKATLSKYREKIKDVVSPEIFNRCAEIFSSRRFTTENVEL